MTSHQRIRPPREIQAPHRSLTTAGFHLRQNLEDLMGLDSRKRLSEKESVYERSPRRLLVR